MKIKQNLLIALTAMALLWAIYLIDLILPINLWAFGIRPRQLNGLWGLLFSPLGLLFRPPGLFFSLPGLLYGQIRGTNGKNQKKSQSHSQSEQAPGSSCPFLRSLFLHLEFMLPLGFTVGSDPFLQLKASLNKGSFSFVQIPMTLGQPVFRFGQGRAPQ